MSLMKKPRMTAKRVAANRANGRRSKGPATPEGRERIRAANTRHGFYSQAEAVALVCLGEDPAELERLRTSLHDGIQNPYALQAELAEHLAQVVWRWKCAGRMQEGYALRLAKDANLTRDDRLHAQMMRLKITAETLRRLAQSVARKHYVTPREDLEMIKNLHQEGVVKDMGEIALVLFYQLQAPGTGEDGMDPDEKSRRALARFKSIFGLDSDVPPQVNVAPISSPPRESPPGAQAGVATDGSPADAGLPTMSGQVPVGAREAHAGLSTRSGPSPVGATEEENARRYPRITAAEWEARERPRQLLENILTRQVEICETQRQAILKESLAGPSPFERAAEIALAHPDAALMQRMEESSFRQIWRITNLLLRIKRQVCEDESQDMLPRSREVYEIKAS